MVEHELPKLGVVGSSPISRSKKAPSKEGLSSFGGSSEPGTDHGAGHKLWLVDLSLVNVTSDAEWGARVVEGLRVLS